MGNQIQNLLLDLAACLCVAVEEADGPNVCFCGVIPGDAAVANYGSNCEDLNGMAWVRLGDLYPSEAVGEQSIKVGSCGTSLGFTVEMGILREMAAPEADGQPPSAQELVDTSNQITTDAITMRKAIMCCSELKSKDYILGNWVPGGPLGLMVGGVWTLSVAL